ncbi:MAG: hypothetical protein GX414_04070 [Acidobacteria bacterium]|nr:hypothetical protein [Acidobacteriota bacterium]
MECLTTRRRREALFRPVLVLMLLLGAGALPAGDRRDASACFTGLNATYSGSWERWDIDLVDGGGTLSATYSGAVDRWSVQIGNRSASISATYSNSMERWDCGDIAIRTVYSGSYERWEVSRGGRTLRVAMIYSNDWQRWSVSGPAGTMHVSATYSHDWSRWQIDDRMCAEDVELRMGAVFACVISAIWAHRNTK